MERYEYDTPDITRQVEGHLFIGPFYRGWNFARLALWVYVPWKLLSLFPYTGALHLALDLGWGALWVYCLYHFSKKAPPRVQAIVLWISVKATGLMAGFITAMAGAPSMWKQGATPAQAGAIFIGGLMMIPGPEFFPKIQPYQKWLTLGRLLVGATCIGYLLITE